MCEKEHIKSGLFVVVFVFLVTVYGRALLTIPELARCSNYTVGWLLRCVPNKKCSIVQLSSSAC